MLVPRLVAVAVAGQARGRRPPPRRRGQAGRGRPHGRLLRGRRRRPRRQPLLLARQDRHQGRRPTARRRTWAETGSPNGHKVLADGTHLVCDASHHAVLHLDADGKVLAPASTKSDGKPLRGPNDLTLDPTVRRLLLHRPGGSDDKKPTAPSTTSTPRAMTHTVAEGLAFPNGIVLRPGGKKLLRRREQAEPHPRLPGRWPRASSASRRSSPTCRPRAAGRSTTSPTACASTPRATSTSPTTACGRSRSSAPRASCSAATPAAT